MSNVKVNKTSKKLDINFERTCSCPDNRLNCLEPKEWVKSQVAIWEFFYEKRDGELPHLIKGSVSCFIT